MAKYTQGSIARHLMIMTASSTMGLMIMFLSELVDMYFLSLLGELQIVAAIGFAGPILFFTVSLNIGLSIACSALVSKAIGLNSKGAGAFSDSESDQGGKSNKLSNPSNSKLTKEAVTYSCVSSVLITLPIAAMLWFYSPDLLRLLGARGEALVLASQYVSIIIPSMPILALAMSAGGVMRAQGDAKGAMWVTMIGGIVNVILDPFFIFTLELGVQGAAIATLLSRVAMLAFGVYVIAYRQQLLGDFKWAHYKTQWLKYIKIALPAALTNLSTPIGVAFLTYIMAQFGDSAVAGNAIISRIQPVAFAGLFALSGIVGPVAGQNFGANKIDRVYETLRESIRFVFYYCFIICALLWLVQPILIPLFNASDEANELVYLFCNGLSFMFVFHGLTYITNALFNNLGVAHYSTVMNFLKVTIGMVPFVYVGVALNGAAGALWGVFIGSAVIALIGVWLAYRLLKQLEHEAKRTQ